MDYRRLAVEGAWEVTPRIHADARGSFLEVFKDEPFREAVGHRFSVEQANTSVSVAGTVRGIHFADVPPGQAKYVTCARGAVFDVAVDIRVGSPTFGAWDSVLLDDVDRRAVYLSEGLGHVFMALEDGSTVTYLCSKPYAPGREHGVHPLDRSIGIVWPTSARDGSSLVPVLSDKDAEAPTIEEAEASGLLPSFAEVVEYRRSL
jgi:dTDP-4-dehydrorhamnose 3,5-epimerase